MGRQINRLQDNPPRSLSPHDIEQIVKERGPFFNIWDALISPGKELIGITSIEKEECEGHFPGADGKNLRVPLIRIQERQAQTGLLYYAYMQKLKGHDTTRLTPIAFAHGAGWPTSNAFPRPPLNLVITARPAPALDLGALCARVKMRLAGLGKAHSMVLNMESTGKWPPRNKEVPIATLQVYYILVPLKMRKGS